MIPVAGYVGQSVGVLGLGRSGLSAARSLRAGGAEALCWDDNPDARAKAEAEGFECLDLGKEAVMSRLSALVVSPGIAHLYPEPNRVVAAALLAGVPVDNDIGLFFASLGSGAWAELDVPPRVVAVTGSNGKSTTSALIAHLIESAGKTAQLAGNIGRGVLDIDEPLSGDVIVLELSSYQTELARALTPDIAVFTNLSPDHLDRHHGMGGYFAAKRRLFAEGGPDRAVIGVDETEGMFLDNQLSAGQGDDRVIRISVERKLTGHGLERLCEEGLFGGVAQGASGGVYRLARGEGAAWCAQPSERLCGLCCVPCARDCAAGHREGVSQLQRLAAPLAADRGGGGYFLRQRQQGDECGRGVYGAAGV